MDAFLGSKRTAACLTFLVLAVFCTLIMTGWWYLLKPTIQHPLASGLAAFLLMILAAFCARQIGQLRAESQRKKEQRRWYYGWKPYIFLAIISAIGTLNAAFVMFESRAILRHDISTMRDAYGTLIDTARQNLTPVDYFGKLARVDGLLENLHEEIVNPNQGRYCGVGPEALRIISEIKTLIPAYRVLNGSGSIYPCDIDKAEKVYQSYANMAHEMIQSDSAFLDANGPAKLKFLNQVNTHFTEMNKALGNLELAALGIGPTDSIDKTALYKTRSTYNSDRKTLINLNKSDLSDVLEIGDFQSDKINSYLIMYDSPPI